MPGVVSTSQPLSPTWTFFEGDWHEGNVAIMGARTQGAWMGSTVFDGARAFEGVTPDLDQHCERINWSARNFLLKPVVGVEQWMGLIADGLKKFDPMAWADHGVGGAVRFDPESTRWCLCMHVSPMPQPKGVAITLSPFRKPTLDCAPVNAKAACLYPNNSRALIEAHARGFDNCVMLDALGNVAELANSNLCLVKDGVVFTPVPNGCFLDGITRRRVIGLLREAGTPVVEASLTYADFLAADEIFSTGNFAKVAPITRIDERVLEIGPVCRQARALYWAFAHEG